MSEKSIIYIILNLYECCLFFRVLKVKDGLFLQHERLPWLTEAFSGGRFVNR